MKKSISPLSLLLLSSMTATHAFTTTIPTTNPPCHNHMNNQQGPTKSSSLLNLVHTTTTTTTATDTTNKMNDNNDNHGNDEVNVSQRRTFLRNVASATFAGMGLITNQEPASATYSAYTNREKDWQARQENGGKKDFFMEDG
jgi:hypothetical protein